MLLICGLAALEAAEDVFLRSGDGGALDSVLAHLGGCSGLCVAADLVSEETCSVLFSSEGVKLLLLGGMDVVGEVISDGLLEVVVQLNVFGKSPPTSDLAAFFPERSGLHLFCVL